MIEKNGEIEAGTSLSQNPLTMGVHCAHHVGLLACLLLVRHDDPGHLDALEERLALHNAREAHHPDCGTPEDLAHPCGGRLPVCRLHACPHHDAVAQADLGLDGGLGRSSWFPACLARLS